MSPPAVFTNATTTALVAVLAMSVYCADTYEFQLQRATSTSACISFRNDSTQAWGYIPSTLVSQQSAEYFCRSYLPSSITGIIKSADYNCKVSQVFQYATNVDCPYNGTSDSNCTVTGSLTPSYQSSTFFGASLSCILSAEWASASDTPSVATGPPQMGGQHGTLTGRSLQISTSFDVKFIRPEASFDVGTICIPDGVNSSLGVDAVKSLCTLAKLPATSNATIKPGIVSNSGYPTYISNLQCPVSNETLWGGACSFDSHFYDVVPGCSPYLPRVSCPIAYDMKLSDPIVSSGAYNGFQVVQLRIQGGTDDAGYNGIMCLLQSSTSKDFYANAVCREMYGVSDDTHFAVLATGSEPLATNTVTYLSYVQCSSSSYTSLSQCSASVTSAYSQSPPCNSYRGVVACRINDRNAIFSLWKDSLPDALGKGYLMVSISATSQNAAAVCSDGFDQPAAFAACRSVGFTPGPNVGFTISNPPSSFNINNISCPNGANKLSDCKLQYSGNKYKIPYAAAQVCGGRVYLDCDVAAPSAQFRVIKDQNYLQARFHDDGEWGWVSVPGGLPTGQLNSLLCSKASLSTPVDDTTITKSFLSVSNCPTGASSYTSCGHEYTNGIALSFGVKCRGSSSSSGSSSPSSTNSGPTGATLLPLAALPIGLGAVIIGIYCYCKHRRTSDDGDTNTRTGGGVSMEEATNHLPETSGGGGNLFSQQASSGDGRATAAPSSSGNAAFARRTSLGQGRNDRNPALEVPNSTLSHHQPPHPTVHQFNIYNPTTSAYPPSQPIDYTSGGGGIYGQPVLGTPYPPQQGGAFGGPPAPYPMGVPASSPPPPTSSSSCNAAPSCGSTSCSPAPTGPYGRGSYN